MRRNTALTALLGAAALAFGSLPARAQQPNADAHRMQATRPELEATLERLRALGQADTSDVRSRLEDGDFRPGATCGIASPTPARS